ncbi:hypothetical protein VNO77_32007 [Canavalia gladiata]|uniref:Exocyst subunit Exo70 family protein n=1 Tax=Canavalia gladiata TaxID=3824 RepID=A0AAN9Q3Z3_CANGL
MVIQILRWLKQPNVWRPVCCASCIVGLVCYALSSSFNHLFGKWTLLKLFLYTVFSLIIWISILFANVWQHSPSLRLKAHLAFLVLIITSVYSFFFDKVVNGKPDPYTLISSAAFAIMSLGLSRQTHYGFEIDLLYFFNGCLTIQLMMIKLFLLVVGACFSYSLITLRSFLDTSPENHHLGLQNHVIIQVDFEQTNTGTGNTDRESLPQNGDLRFQNHIVTHMDSHSSQHNSDTDLIKPQLMASIKALKKKNRKLIHIFSKHMEKYLEAIVDSKKLTQLQLLTDVNLVMDVIPSKTIGDLQETVKLVAAAGFGKECFHVYSSCRREFLQQCLLRFGLQELNMEDVDRMEKIENWRKAFNVAVKILFTNERRLCDCVFHGIPFAADISFMEVCRDLTIHLLSFANTFTSESRSLNLLCSIIPQVWETLLELIPEFKSLFSDQYSVSLRSELFTVLKKLKEDVRGLFTELKNLICHDLARVVVPGGRLHPITCVVMNCLRDITPNHVLEEYSLGPDRVGNSSLFSVQIAWITEHLDYRLEANSKNYMNPALGYVFMINNRRYVAEVIGKNHRLQAILGKDWTRKHTAKIQQNLEDYQRSTWNKVVEFLKVENDGLVAPSINVAKSMKDGLNLFNHYFEEICHIQAKWFIYDEQQREQIRISLENMLLPAYGSFVTRFQDVLGNQADKHIKYGMFQIADKLNNLFLGSKEIEQAAAAKEK